MSELNRIFSELKTYYQQNINWVDIEELLYGEESGSDALNERGQKFWELSMCSQDLNQRDGQLQVLRELAGVVRSMRSDEHTSYDNTYDNWATIVSVSPPNAYLAYIYAVTSLAMLPEHIVQNAPRSYTEHSNIQLSLNAVSTYLLTLTIPGAKSFGIFDEDVIEQCLKVFKLLEQNANQSSHANMIWMSFLTIYDDLKLVFRYVHFKEHLKPRDKIMRCLMDILYMHFKQGFTNSCKSHTLFT